MKKNSSLSDDVCKIALMTCKMLTDALMWSMLCWFNRDSPSAVWVLSLLLAICLSKCQWNSPAAEEYLLLYTIHGKVSPIFCSTIGHCPLGVQACQIYGSYSRFVAGSVDAGFIQRISAKIKRGRLELFLESSRIILISLVQTPTTVSG